MDYEKISLKKFSIVGIAIRTTNKDNQAQKDIAELWKKFQENNMADSIPFKVSDDIYCVYTDYESDFRGKYTTIIGCQVSDTNDSNDEFIYKDILDGEFLKFTADENTQNATGKIWNHIWHSNYDRKYLADFDVYKKDKNNSENIKVVTYLSVK